MEDIATGEIRLSILWEWLHKGARLSDDDQSPGVGAGTPFSRALFERLLEEEYERLRVAGNRDVHDDSKVTTLPVARAAFERCDSLHAAFRAVFASLGLPWTRQRNLTTAVLLALLGGIFGLHHFYMGQARKGVWCIAFFWLAIPILLGWIDAVRLALLDDAQFQGRLKPVPSPVQARAGEAPQRAG